MSYFGTTEIGKMFLGDTGISKAYLGDTLVFQEGETPVVLIPYIRNTNLTEYIDTGITADSTTRIIVWARNLNPANSFMCGARVSASESAFGITAPETPYVGNIRFDYGSQLTYLSDMFTQLSDYHKYELNCNDFYIDDVLIDSAPSSTFDSQLNIHIFGVNNGGTHASQNFPMDVCACQIYKGGILVRDYTAVNSPSIGLYDSISDTLFTNAGSGAFTYGTFNPDAYTRLEYVECNKQQYFDSGVYGSYADSLVVKFRPTETSQQLYDVVGCINTSTASAARLTIGASNSLNNRAYWNFGPNTTTV